MKKLRILIDMDGIVANTLPYWLKRIAEKTKVVAQVEDIKQWGMHLCPPLTEADPKIIYGTLQDPDFTMNIPPMWGAAEAVKQLMEDGHDVMFLTARHGPVSMPATLDWTRKHFPFMNAERQVSFVYDKWRVTGDVLIDDKAETLEEYAGAHPEALVMGIQYPYNERLLENPRFKLFGGKAYLDRTLTWGQILGYLQAYAGK